MTGRVIFIPGMRDRITKNLVSQGYKEEDVKHSLKLWNIGEQPASDTERQIFVFLYEISDYIRKDVKNV